MSKQFLREPIIIVKVLGEDDGYWDPTAGSEVACVRVAPPDVTITDCLDMEASGVLFVDGDEDRVIKCYNFRNNIPVIGKRYLAFRIGNCYVIDNQSVFAEYM